MALCSTLDSRSVANFPKNESKSFERIKGQLAVDGIFFIIAYLCFVAWFSWLPVKTTYRYHPPYFWRWTTLLTSSGPLLSTLILIGFLLSATSDEAYGSFMATGFFMILALLPFQILIAVTVYLFICSSLKARYLSLENESASGEH